GRPECLGSNCHAAPCYRKSPSLVLPQVPAWLTRLTSPRWAPTSRGFSFTSVVPPVLRYSDVAGEGRARSESLVRVGWLGRFRCVAFGRSFHFGCRTQQLISTIEKCLALL